MNLELGRQRQEALREENAVMILEIFSQVSGMQPQIFGYDQQMISVIQEELESVRGMR